MQSRNCLTEAPPVLSWVAVENATIYTAQLQDNVTEQEVFLKKTTDLGATSSDDLSFDTYCWQVTAPIPCLTKIFTNLTPRLQDIDATISEIEARDMEF